MRRRTARTARESWAMNCPRSCGAEGPAGEDQAGPKGPGGSSGRSRCCLLPMLSRRNKRMPANSTSCARRRVAHGRKQRPPEIWRSRRPVRQALSPRDWSPRRPTPSPSVGLPIGPMAAPRPVRRLARAAVMAPRWFSCRKRSGRRVTITAVSA